MYFYIGQVAIWYVTCEIVLNILAKSFFQQVAVWYSFTGAGNIRWYVTSDIVLQEAMLGTFKVLEIFIEKVQSVDTSVLTQDLLSL